MTPEKRKSQKQEKRVAKEIKGLTTIASGALWGNKGDVRNDEYLVECKITKREFYILKRDVWDKIRKEAVKDGLRIPVMNIEVEDGKYAFAVLDKLTGEELFYPVSVHRSHTEAKSIRIQGNMLYPQIIDFTTNGNIDFSLFIVEWEDFIDRISGVIPLF